MKIKLFSLTLLFLSSCFLYVTAGNFTVSNVTQFQTALSTAASNSENDTINVLAGTYNVNPTLIFYSSENYFLLIMGSGSPVFNGGNTRQIIQLTTTANNADIIIDGLVIQNGRADYGGGINVHTEGADITIRNCIFNDNVSNYICGGANLSSNTGNITVTSCSFNRNSSPNTSGYPYGTAGGLFIQTTEAGPIITMKDCSFNQNTAQRDAAGAMLYPLGVNTTVIAEWNTFTSNIAKEAGGGCWIRVPAGNTAVIYRNNTLTGNSSSTGGNGAGTYIQIASGTIEIYDNVHSLNNASWQGGALWVEHSGGTMNIYRNRFISNTSGESAGGANIFLDYGTLKLHHNVFARNRTLGAGGGLNLSTTTGNLHLYNNIFYLNSSSEGGDIYIYLDNPSSTSNFYNNILYNSSLPALSFSGQQIVTARYSNIQGGIGQTWFGTGCIDRQPYFRDTANNNFHLQDSIHCNDPHYSPCIDAGNPVVQDSILNCDWGLGTMRSDMGIYGGISAVSIGIKKISLIVPQNFLLYQNYPNPFNQVTKIKFSIPALTGHNHLLQTRLVIYNLLGQEISILVNEALGSGTYEVSWEGKGYSSGVYYYKLFTENYTETKKMILLN